MARSCARRSLAAAIIFIALVIWRVLFTLRMRRRRSRTFAMRGSGLLGFFLLLLLFLGKFLHRRLLQRRIVMLGEEVLLIFFKRILDPISQVVVQRLFTHNVLQQPRLCRIQVGIKPVLERADLLYLHVIEKAIGTSENDNDLLLGG